MFDLLGILIVAALYIAVLFVGFYIGAHLVAIAMAFIYPPSIPFFDEFLKSISFTEIIKRRFPGSQ